MTTILRDLPPGHVVAVDTETSGLYTDDGARVAVVSFAYRDPADGQLVSRAIPFDQGHLKLPLGDKELSKRHLNRIKRWADLGPYPHEVAPNYVPGVYIELLDILSRHRLIFHNGKFDLIMIFAGLRGVAGLDLGARFHWDTQIGQHVIDPQYPTALKSSAVRLELTGGAEDEAQEALKPFLGPKTDARYDLVPWSVMRRYAAEDAELTILLYEYQQQCLEEEPALHRQLTIDFNAMLTLFEMEKRGVGFDAKRSLAEADRLAFERAEVAKQLPFRVTPPGAKKHFFGELIEYDSGDSGWSVRPPYPGKVTKPSKRHPKGQPQLDEEVQELLIQDGAPYAKEYRYHEQLKSAESKWYRPWGERCGADGRLRPTYRNTTVVTGRLSAERVNLLAIPHPGQMPALADLVPVRDLFVPANGCALWEVDVSQAEVRVGAAIAECGGLLRGYEAGIDAHSQVSITLFGDDAPAHRRIAKTTNLAMQYWAGVGRLRGQLEKDTGRKWSDKKVKALKDEWTHHFPEMVEAMYLAKSQAEILGHVVLWSGRYRWFDHQRGGPPEPTYSAFNAKCQGGVAEVMKIIMARWEREHPGTLLIQTHDALLLELPSEQAEELAIRCEEMMVAEFEKAMAHRWKNGEFVTMPFAADRKKYNDA